MILRWLAVAFVCVLLAVTSAVFALSYRHDRTAQPFVDREMFAAMMVSGVPAPSGDADLEYAAALRWNPYEAALWSHRASNFSTLDCSESRAICEERIQWLTRAVRLRPILDRAWAQLAVAQLQNGNVGEARFALQRAQAFAPYEYQTGVATLKVGLSQWHAIEQTEREIVISTLSALFAQAPTEVISLAQSFDDQALFGTLLQRAGIREEFDAALKRQQKMLEKIERAKNAQRAR